MKGLRVCGDPNNTKSCSSEIIISSLNQGLIKLGLYDEHGEIVVYDCLAQSHGFKTNYIICAYETSIPSPVFINAGGRHLIGVSNQNQSFFLDGGYDKELTHSMLLGVDSKLWSSKHKPKKDKFRFGMMCDSNTRADYDSLLVAFGNAFRDKKNVELYIKDRWATETFRNHVKAYAAHFGIQVILDDEHVTDKAQEVEIYNSLDCHVFLNRTSTFALTVAQGMAMQIPTVVISYSGPRDYCNELNSCLVPFALKEVTPFKIMNLEARGYRNYLMTNPSLFQSPPLWAEPMPGVQDLLLKIYEDRGYREKIAYNGRATVESLTWDRAALNLAWIVNQ